MDSQLSKSEKKRRAKSIEQLVSELASLSEGQINDLPCIQEIKDEILSAMNLKGGARKRQLKYATKLLRNEPVEDLYAFLAKKKGSQLKKSREFHNLEYMRDLVITEVVEIYEEIEHSERFIEDNVQIEFPDYSEALALIESHLPDIDQELIKNTAVKFAKTRNRKFSREIFRILKAAFEKDQYIQNKEKANGI